MQNEKYTVGSELKRIAATINLPLEEVVLDYWNIIKLTTDLYSSSSRNIFALDCLSEMYFSEEEFED